MFEFKLADLGEGIHEAEILKWYVAVGEPIDEDAPLVDVETDKAAVTIPSPRGGKVVHLAGDVGDVIHVGDVVAVIDDGSGAQTSPAAVAPAAPAQTAQPSPRPAGPVPAAPATRRLARELDVDLDQVPPTGPGGRVTPEDVQRFAAPGDDALEPPETVTEPVATAIPLLDLEPLPDFSQFGPVEKEPLRSIRRKVARKMTTSSLLVAQVSHTDEVDVTDLDALRRRERSLRDGQPGGRLTLLAFFVKAITAGLRENRAFNASIDPLRGEIIYKSYYNIGIAVATDKGLIVPVLKDADRKSVLQLSAEIESLAARAREDRLTVEDLRGGTFTLSNIGPLGGFSPNPIVNHPEVGLLGMGAIGEKPVVRDGEIVVRKMMPLALSFDHRIADGADAARFLNNLVRRIASPNALLVEC